MDLKKIALEKIRCCDLINDEIYKLKKQEQILREEIASIKKQIEKNNYHLIGKKAWCITNGFQNKECTCTGVRCNENLEITPLFNHKNNKVNVESFEWI